MQVVIPPRILCASCLLTCYEQEPTEPYVVCIERFQCNCPNCRHFPTWGNEENERKRKKKSR